MSSQRGGQKTPARVQVFYFEKKASRPAPPVPAPAPGCEPDLPTSPGIELPVELMDGAPTPVPTRPPGASRITRPGRRRSTEKVPTVDHHSAPTEREMPRVQTPAPVPNGCARETLEYHRLKLQQLAARDRKRGTGSPADLALFGYTLYARGRLREAQVVFESIVSKEPDEAFAYTMLGAIFLARDDDARALALFDAALSMDARDIAALVGRGELRLRRGQPQAALSDLERAICADPSGRDPFGERARGLLVLARTLSRALR